MVTTFRKFKLQEALLAGCNMFAEYLLDYSLVLLDLAIRLDCTSVSWALRFLLLCRLEHLTES